MQDTFARATRSLGGYRGGNSKSWLFAIARSVFIDDVRKRRPVPTEDIDTAHSTDPDVAEIDVISEALAALPERQRTALLLADPSWTAGGMLGYATCQPPLDDLDDDILGATSAVSAGARGSSSAMRRSTPPSSRLLLPSPTSRAAMSWSIIWWSLSTMSGTASERS
jgi:hypothetical protein